MIVESPIVVPPELRGTLCPNCGYSLAGLNLDDKCSECGRQCNASELVLYANDLRSETERRASKMQRIPDSVIAGVAAYVPFDLIFGAGRWYYGICLLASAACSRLMRMDSQHPAEIQIRINSHGIVQFAHAGGARTFGKLKAEFLWILPTFAALLLIGEWAVRPAEVTVWLYIPLSLLMLFFSAITIKRAYRFHRASRSISDNAIVDFNLALTSPSPWEEIREYWITAGNNNFYLLRIDDELHKPGAFVTAQVELSPSGAAALHNLLKERILAARPAPVDTNVTPSEMMP